MLASVFSQAGGTGAKAVTDRTSISCLFRQFFQAALQPETRNGGKLWPPSGVGQGGWGTVQQERNRLDCGRPRGMAPHRRQSGRAAWRKHSIVGSQ